MKKNVILLLCFAFVFTSCENFFKGENVRQQLEDRIAYANAPSYKITIDYPGAWGTIKAPVGGQTEKKVTDVFPLTFNTFVDYDFVCWKIIDSVTQKELKNGEYLLIDSLDKEDTMCTFVKAPEQGMQLCICIELAERPMIISRYPMTSNVIRDVSILVDFDMEMNPDSIYYTQPEYEQLIKDPKKTLLSVNLANGTKYYGYTTGSGNNIQYYFKNISITDKKTGKSILNCFRAPVFENNNTSLVIKPDAFNPPESYTSVLVNLEKGFFSTLKDADNNKIKDVEIAGSTKWMYKVNNGRDTKPLILLNNQIKTVTINSKSLSSVTQPSDATFTSAMSSMLFVKNLELSLDLTVQEAASAEGGASGPDLTFTLTLERLYDKDYKAVSNISKDIVIDYNGKGSQATGASSDEEASYKGTINLATETGNFISNTTATDGVYAMSFVFKDKAGNSLTYPSDGKKLCFAKDGTGISVPQLLTAEDCIIPISNGKYRIKWKTPTVKDCKNTSIIVKDYYNNSQIVIDKTSTNNYFDVDLSEKNGSFYTIILEHKDYAGNTGTAYEFKLNKYAFSQGLQKAGSDYVICGHYPQSAMPQSESVQINRRVYNGWILGTDGYFYETYQNNYGQNFYYRIEPILWRILNRKTQTEGYTILLAENILYTGVYYRTSDGTRNENGHTIYPNDYEYSDISSSLNDAFINKAFTIEEWNKLKLTDRHYFVSRNGAMPPEQVTVQDRVFLLEYDEIRFLDYTILRKRYTDYALKDKGTSTFGSWWYLFPKTTEKTQSIGGHNTHVVDKANEDAIVDRNGEFDRDNKTERVDYTNGIVPAIAVASGDIPTN